MPDPNGAAVARTNELAERRFCWNAHLAHNTYEQIAAMAAEQFQRSFSRSTVHRRIEAERELLREEIRRDAQAELDSMLARLDAQAAVHTRAAARAEQLAEAAVAQGGFDDKAEAALSRALAGLLTVGERRAKLLGLDAAVRVEHSGTVEVVDGEAAELARILDAAAQHAAEERERANAPL